ncbi:MAG: hypothetical protein Q7S27_01215 [Nanoarchaeota archaeon]|nr:hypothetical protein [Nanoarchaeota archaeon]
MGYESGEFSQMERSTWESIPSDLVGKVLNSQDELKEFFPLNDDYSEIRAIPNEGGDGGRGFIRFIRIYKNTRYGQSVAYQCHDCKKIVVGSPEIKDINDIGPLCGREGYEVNCTNCYTKLDGGIISMS